MADRGGRVAAWLPLALLLAAFVAMRLYHAGSPLVDDSDWRQTDTASEAWFFVRDGVDLLRPQFFYDGPGPNYVQLETPYIPATVAELARHAGLPFGAWLLHGTAVAYSTGAVLFLYGFARRRLGARAAWLAAAAYTVQPLGIFFGRAFQPEPAMLCGSMAALYFADRWRERPTSARLAAAVAASVFAVTAKLPGALVAAPVFALAMERVSWRDVRPWVLVGTPAAAAAAYTLAAGLASAHGQDYVLRILHALAARPGFHVGTASAARYWRRFLWRMSVTPALALPAAIGVAASRKQAWFWAWAGALALWCLLIVRHIRFEYYLLPVLPWLAIAAGAGLDAMVGWLGSQRALSVLACTAALALAPLLAWGPLAQLYHLNLRDYQAGLALRARLGPGPIILGTSNPPILFYSRHHGWRTDQLTMAELQTWRAAGAVYLVPIGALGTAAMRQYVPAHFAAEHAGPVLYYVLR